jgi:hypothetical protein
MAMQYRCFRCAAAHCGLHCRLLKEMPLASEHAMYLLKACIDNAADFDKHFGACFQCCPFLHSNDHRNPPVDTPLFDLAQLVTSAGVQELLTHYTSSE